jgi:hypothetical protein
VSKHAALSPDAVGLFLSQTQDSRSNQWLFSTTAHRLRPKKLIFFIPIQLMEQRPELRGKLMVGRIIDQRGGILV